MADLGYDYNAEDHRPMENRDPIPAGKYEAQIVESSVDDTKKGDGKVLKMVWQVIGPDHEGRKVFDRVNLANPNAQAVEIGQRQLSSICRAVGKLRITDSAELHDVPCIISVKIRPPKGDYAASNEINGYYTASGESTDAAPAQQQQQPAPAPARQAPAPAPQRSAPAASRQPVGAGAGGGKPPWARK